MWFSTLRGGERKFRRHGKCDDDGSRMVMEQLGSKRIQLGFNQSEVSPFQCPYRDPVRQRCHGPLRDALLIEGQGG
jgi:hypothetical protein